MTVVSKLVDEVAGSTRTSFIAVGTGTPAIEATRRLQTIATVTRMASAPSRCQARTASARVGVVQGFENGECAADRAQTQFGLYPVTYDVELLWPGNCGGVLFGHYEYRSKTGVMRTAREIPRPRDHAQIGAHACAEGAGVRCRAAWQGAPMTGP